jgi:hypothetical protein
MVGTRPSPEAQLSGFLAKYLPATARQFRSARKLMLARLPGAIELVYDNWNWLVIGYSPTRRPSEAMFSLVGAPRWITLCFLRNGAILNDPQRLLRGSGKRIRNVRLEHAKDLEAPAIAALIDQSLELARFPFDPKAQGTLIIQSVSAKQRPRRPN